MRFGSFACLAHTHAYRILLASVHPSHMRTCTNYEYRANAFKRCANVTMACRQGNLAAAGAAAVAAAAKARTVASGGGGSSAAAAAAAALGRRAAGGGSGGGGMEPAFAPERVVDSFEGEWQQGVHVKQCQQQVCYICRCRRRSVAAVGAI